MLKNENCGVKTVDFIYINQIMSDKYKGIYRGQTFRLQHWDYGSEGLYFITICTQNREHFFGKITEGKMNLSEIGGIVHSEWLKTPSIRPDMNLELVEFIVMPNHFHAIIHIGLNEYNKLTIKNETNRNVSDGNVSDGNVSDGNVSDGNVSDGNVSDGNVSDGNCRVAMHCDPTIPTSKIIPIQTKKSKNQFGPQSKNLASIVRGFKSAVTTWCRKNNYPDFKWQSLFHDHIIRNQQAFEKIRQYIIDNPQNWKDDTFYE